jgi:hypothetical protein
MVHVSPEFPCILTVTLGNIRAAPAKACMGAKDRQAASAAAKIRFFIILTTLPSFRQGVFSKTKCFRNTPNKINAGTPVPSIPYDNDNANFARRQYIL